MLNHYFKFFFRYFKRNSLLSSINILSLCIGIVSCIFITLFILNEYSYDSFHSNAKNIVKVYGQFKNTDGTDEFLSRFTKDFTTNVQSQNPEIINTARIRTGKKIVLYSDKNYMFNEENYLITGSSFFKIFTFPFIRGNSAHALDEPNTVIITDRLAKKYFNTDDVIGKTLTCNDTVLLKITGVVKPAPFNSSINFDLLLSEVSNEKLVKNDKAGHANARNSLDTYDTYFLLQNENSAKTLTKNINEQFKGNVIFGSKIRYTLIPLTKMFLNAPDGDTSRRKNIYIFIAIGIIVLVLSVINYLNLTISFSYKRIREATIRRLLGSSNMQLAKQFIMESLLLFGGSLAISILLFLCLGKYLYHILGIELGDSVSLYSLAFVVMVVLLVIGLLSSSLFFINYLIKSTFVNTGSIVFSQNKTLKKQRLLTVFQFFISQTLIICSLIASNQLQFIRHKDIGFNKDNVMVIPLDPSMINSYKAFKNEIAQQSGVESVAASTLKVFKNGPNGIRVKKQVSNDLQDIQIMTVDENFFKTLALKWDIKPSGDALLTKPLTMLLNESAMRQLNITKATLNDPINLDGDQYTVTGVIKDFNISSLKNKIEPLIITVDADSLKEFAKYSGGLYVHFNGNTNINTQINVIQSIFKKYQIAKPFEYYFVDSEYNQLYSTEDKVSELFKVFTFISISLACLGLFALITFTAKNKLREISIRKVLGASISSIIFFVSKDIILVMILGISLAWPLSYWIINDWLKDFAFRVDIKISTFILASVLMAVITVITVGYQLIRASLINPVKILKND
ncbi:ABC transporter permease [Mucilaginibacter sp. FT3.2]|uniref:ABC transporter permease n=1 Tax=Mucilaginibacter sp. FT3.2 TaxID=2723090 RepID=UPI001616E58D|nr:ABC transporter permease [Mucilaginibacter sp. FT3.2]MBB6232725.1 putative ABC transport system permease protein [Mucilaginibacter sp. FT3.2]